MTASAGNMRKAQAASHVIDAPGSVDVGHGDAGCVRLREIATLVRTEMDAGAWFTAAIPLAGEFAMHLDNSRIAGCKRAVVTAYRELRELGASDLYSFDACTTLYRIHHPRASTDDAHRLIAEWVDRQQIEVIGARTGGAAAIDRSDHHDRRAGATANDRTLAQGSGSQDGVSTQWEIRLELGGQMGGQR